MFGRMRNKFGRFVQRQAYKGIRKYTPFNKGKSLVRYLKGSSKSRIIRKLMPKYQPSTETKLVDVAINQNCAQNTDGFTLLMNGIAQGVAQGQRIGSKVCLKSFFLRGRLGLNTVGTNPITRIMLVLDTKSCFVDVPLTGASSATGRLLATTTTNAFPWTQNEYENKDRYVILFDKVYNHQPPFTGSSQNMPIYIFHKFKKPIEVEYGGTGSTVASINSNSLYLMAICDQTVASGNFSNLLGTARVKYTDI